MKEVHLIGRRGPLQAAFTIKELREMLKLDNCQTSWCSADFDGVQDVVPKLARPRKRITELMLKSLNETTNTGEKQFKPVFYKSPVEFKGSENVQQVILGINKLEGDDLINKTAILTDEREYLDCNLAVTSIGYKSIQADPELPFDESKGIVINKSGRIGDGLYTTGWLATGPTGVILTTMNNAFCTADVICQDLKNDSKHVLKPGFELIGRHLQQQNVQVIGWENWLKIDTYEQEQGKKLGKPREKILDIKKMLEIAS